MRSNPIIAPVFCALISITQARAKAQAIPPTPAVATSTAGAEQVRRPVLSLARLLIYFTAPTTSTPAFVYGNYYNWKCGGNEYRYKRRLPVLFDGSCHHSQRYSIHCPLPKILVLGRHSVDKKLPDYQHGWQRHCWLRFRHNQQLPNIRAALSSCTVLSLSRKIHLHPTHSLPIFAYNLHRRFPGKPEPSDLT